MSIQITLRRNKEFSPFRKQLLEICEIPSHGDLILCSGYIGETPSYSVLDDELLDAIKIGLSGNKIICVAGKFATKKPVNWLQHYKDFVAKLQSHGISVTAKVAPKRNWHAKIAVRLNSNGEPVVAMVGSSNLTGPAYGENRYSWNYECDVTIWKNKAQWDALLPEDRQPTEDPFTTMALVLDPDVSNQPSIEERLATLVQDIYREEQTFIDLSEYQ